MDMHRYHHNDEEQPTFFLEEISGRRTESVKAEILAWLSAIFVIFLVIFLLFFAFAYEAKASTVAPIDISSSGSTGTSWSLGLGPLSYCGYFSTDNGTSETRWNCDSNYPDSYDTNVEGWGFGDGVYTYYWMASENTPTANCPAYVAGKAECENYAPYKSVFTRTNGVWSDSYTPSYGGSGVTLSTPVDGTTLTSSPVLFSGVYNNVAPDMYNKLQFKLEGITEGLNNMSIFVPDIDLDSINGSNIPFSTKKRMYQMGEYTIQARLYNSANSSSTEWTALRTFILVGTSTTSTTTQANTFGSPTPLDCGTFDIGCYIKNAVMWLFWPEADDINQFLSLKTTMESRFPFAYATDIADLRTELFSATRNGSDGISVTTSIGDFTFISSALISDVPFSSTIKQLLTWLMWFMMVEYVYYKLIRTHDSVTPA